MRPLEGAVAPSEREGYEYTACIAQPSHPRSCEALSSAYRERTSDRLTPLKGVVLSCIHSQHICGVFKERGLRFTN